MKVPEEISLLMLLIEVFDIGTNNHIINNNNNNLLNINNNNNNNLLNNNINNNNLINNNNNYESVFIMDCLYSLFYLSLLSSTALRV